MKNYPLLCLALLVASAAVGAHDTAQSELKLDLLPNEAWWGGAVTLGSKMPYGVAPIDINLDGDNRGNQYAPLLVSSKGRYEDVKDQFLMGEDLLVAPMVGKGTSRTVLIPPGSWKADDGSLIFGPVQKTFDVPLTRLLYFERQ